jgi:hypothetical protein
MVGSDKLTLDVKYEGIGGTAYGPSSEAPVNAGEYRVILSVPNNEKYVGEAHRDYTISKRPLKISIDPPTTEMNQGASLPDKGTFTVKYENFVGSDNASTTLSGLAVVKISVSTSASPGTYAVIAEGATLNTAAGANYTIIPEDIIHGKLIIKPSSSACNILTVNDPFGSSLVGNTITSWVSTDRRNQPIDVEVSPDATWKLYSDARYSNEINDKTMALNGDSETLYIIVTAQNGISVKHYTLSIIPITTSSGGSATRRQITLPAVPGTTTNPSYGIHYVGSGGDFTFTITPTPGNASSLLPLVRTNRTIGSDADNITNTKNANGSYTIRISGIRETISLSITWNMNLESSGGVDNEEAAESSRAWSAGSQLLISSPLSGEARVISTGGALVKSIPYAAGETVVTPLPRGFYVVVLSDGKVFKVVVR